LGDESPDQNIVKDPDGVKLESDNSFDRLFCFSSYGRFSLVLRLEPRYLVSMVTSSTITLSGMRFAESRLASGAHNTANVGTDAFSRQQVRGVERPGGGVKTVTDSTRMPSNDQQLAEALPGAQNNVSLVQETVNRIAAVRSFEANATVVRTQDQLSQSLLDLTA
jgi:hypothetical protein